MTLRNFQFLLILAPPLDKRDSDAGTYCPVKISASVFQAGRTPHNSGEWVKERRQDGWWWGKVFICDWEISYKPVIWQKCPWDLLRPLVACSNNNNPPKNVINTLNCTTYEGNTTQFRISAVWNRCRWKLSLIMPALFAHVLYVSLVPRQERRVICIYCRCELSCHWSLASLIYHLLSKHTADAESPPPPHQRQMTLDSLQRRNR